MEAGESVKSQPFQVDENLIMRTQIRNATTGRYKINLLFPFVAIAFFIIGFTEKNVAFYAIGVLLLTLPMLFLILLHRMKKSASLHEIERTVELTPTAYKHQDSTGNSCAIAWERFQSVKISGDTLELDLGLMSFFMIPKSAFTPDQLVEALELLQEKGLLTRG